MNIFNALIVKAFSEVESHPSATNLHRAVERILSVPGIVL